MTKRFWGEEKDIEAAKQLGLKGDHTIFMMGCEADYADDINEIASEFDEIGYVGAREVIDAVQDRIRMVKLPKGFALVGMAPVGIDGEKVYGGRGLHAVW